MEQHDDDISLAWSDAPARRLLPRPARSEFRAILFLLAVAMTGGAVFFRFVESWSWVDAFYFSAMALTTVGDATLSPTTALAKIFTMLFSICGIGLMLAFLSRLSTFRDDRAREKTRE